MSEKKSCKYCGKELETDESQEGCCSQECLDQWNESGSGSGEGLIG